VACSNSIRTRLTCTLLNHVSCEAVGCSHGVSTAVRSSPICSRGRLFHMCSCTRAPDEVCEVHQVCIVRQQRRLRYQNEEQCYCRSRAWRRGRWWLGCKFCFQRPVPRTRPDLRKHAAPSAHFPDSCGIYPPARAVLLALIVLSSCDFSHQAHRCQLQGQCGVMF